MRIKKKTVFLFFSSIIWLLFVAIGSASAAEPARVLVLPFNIHPSMYGLNEGSWVCPGRLCHPGPRRVM